MKRITDKGFVYVNSASTDIRKTFDRARREIAEKQERERVEAEWRLKNAINLRKCK